MNYKITLPDIKYGHLTPEEDAYSQTDNIFAVADGISRDPSYEMDFTKTSPEELLKNYPNPSGATMAAKTFCEIFTKVAKSGNDIKNAFIKANQEIKTLNEKYVPEVDYLVNDFYGCVACGGIIENGILKWGVVGDCGIVVYNSQGEIKFETPNSFSTFENFVRAGKIQFKWEQQEGRKLVRTKYRNKPDQLIDGVCASYGALTGEETAENFIYTGELELHKKDLVIFYSDGFEATVKSPEFYLKILDTDKFEQYSLELAKTDREKYGKERTLIATVYDQQPASN